MRKAAGWRWFVATLLLAATGALALAGEHYTEYGYDADGRVQQIRTAVDDAPPQVTSVLPAIVRRGPPTRVTVLGSSLRAAQIATSHSGLSVSAITATAGKISFDLTAAPTVPLGPHTLTLSTVLGSVDAPITVRPRLPVLLLSPNPMALAPGSVAALTVALDAADVIDHTLQLGSSAPLVAGITPASVTIAAGTLQAPEPVLVHALTLGTSVLRFDTEEIRDVAAPLFVTAPYKPPPGGASFHALLLGLQLGAPPVPPVLIERGPFVARVGLTMPAPLAVGDGTVAPVAAPLLGVAVGSVVTSLSPGVVIRGSGVTVLTAHGVGLEGVTQVVVSPADGVLATLVSASAGSVSLEIDAAPGAALGIRQLRLLNAQQVAVPAAGAADRIVISDPVPQLASVSPQLLVRGAGAQQMTLRGSLLAGATAVSVLPPDGVNVGAELIALEDGRRLDVSLVVAANATLGPRTLIVTSPAGSSDAVAGPGNTVTIVSGIARAVSPLAAASLGVVFGDSEDAPATARVLQTPLLGLNVGAGVTGLAPRAKSAGSELVLQVFGFGLDGVQAVTLEPATGLTVGDVSVAADGLSLSVPLSIDASAPRLPRRVVLSTAQGVLLPAAPDAAQFLVTDAVPEVDSLTPMHVVTGAPVSVLTLRGRNFAGASAVHASPADGVVLGPPQVAPDALSMSVTMFAAADAARTVRVISVTTPAGVSDVQPADANRLHVIGGIAAQVSQVAAPLLGVQFGDGAGADAVDRLFAAPLLGLSVGAEAPPAVGPVLLAGAPLGITVGASISAVAPRYLAVDGNVQLHIDGVSLQGVDAISVTPPDGINVGGPLQIAADGLSLTVPLGIDASAAKIMRRIVVSAAGVPLPESSAAAAQVLVVGKEPLIASIEPIQVVPGQAFVLTVRGINLFGASAVTATPGTGLAIGNNPSVNADGSELSIAVNVSPNAPAGPRVIRVTAGGGSTAAEATPANTLHVVDDD